MLLVVLLLLVGVATGGVVVAVAGVAVGIVGFVVVVVVVVVVVNSGTYIFILRSPAGRNALNCLKQFVDKVKTSSKGGCAEMLMSPQRGSAGGDLQGGSAETIDLPGGLSYSCRAP